jgi:hypothetical protein
MADQNINNMTVTWNSGGTTFDAVKMNVTDTASAAASRLLLLQVGGSDKFKVGKDGSVTTAGGLSVTGNSTITGNLTVTGTLTAGGIAGSVTGPASSTDNAVSRFNGTSGGVIQNSGVIIDDSNNVTGVVALTATGALKCAQDFTSSTAAVALNTTGAGNVYLRPNGAGSATGQLQVASSGAVTVNGTLSATGDITYSSDKRLKTNILPLDRAAAVEMVRAVKPVSFNRIRDDARCIGFIAQDVEKWEPRLINKDDEGYLSLAYGNMVAVLWEAVRDLQEKVAA